MVQLKCAVYRFEIFQVLGLSQGRVGGR